jgi:hypothetical protein
MRREDIAGAQGRELSGLRQLGRLGRRGRLGREAIDVVPGRGRILREPGEPLLVVVDRAAQDLELVADAPAEPLVEVLLAEQLVGELHGDQQGHALEALLVGDPPACR